MSDNRSQQILCKIALARAMLVALAASVHAIECSFHPSIPTIQLYPRGKRAPAMYRAPLRLIHSRSLDVFSLNRGRHRHFAVVDALACGHTYTSLLWELLDLLNAYTDNPEVAARRRRCRVCQKEAICSATVAADTRLHSGMAA